MSTAAGFRECQRLCLSTCRRESHCLLSITTVYSDKKQGSRSCPWRQTVNTLRLRLPVRGRGSPVGFPMSGTEPWFHSSSSHGNKQLRGFRVSRFKSPMQCFSFLIPKFWIVSPIPTKYDACAVRPLYSSLPPESMSRT